MKKSLLALSLVIAGAAAPLRAQEIGDRLSAIGAENGRRYFDPLAQGLGHALTAGFVSSADPHGMLGFSIGVRGVGALFPSNTETFTVDVPSSITYNGQTFTNPYTVSNGGVSTTVRKDGARATLSPANSYKSALLATNKNPNDYNITLPPGVDLPIAPFGVVDASLGIGFGTQVMARVLPTIKIPGASDVGSVSALGIGVMHNLKQYFPIPSPFWNLSAVAGIQKLSAGDYLSSKGTTLGLVGSVGLGPLSAYAHASTYTASMDVDYTVKNTNNDPGLPANGVEVKFSDPLGRKERLAIGAQLDLLLVKATVEYGMGAYKTVSAGAYVGLR